MNAGVHVWIDADKNVSRFIEVLCCLLGYVLNRIRYRC